MGKRTAWVAAGVALFGIGLLLPAIAGNAATLPGGLGPCLGAACPDPFPPVHNGDFAGFDENINVYVGGDYFVRQSAAEAEGRVVAIGNFDLARDTQGGYNVGIAGVGSRVPPPLGSDFLIVGGNITVAAAPTQRIIADQGVVRHAGSASALISGTVIQDPNAVVPYAGLAGQLTIASQCYATSVATGTIRNDGFGSFTFEGDGTSALQVFNLDQDLTGLGGGGAVVAFTAIPAGATVLVNVTKPGTWTQNVLNGDLQDADPWNQLRERLLWNIATPETVNFVGLGQFQGSVLVSQPSSMTTFSQSGMAGRFFTAGSLTHGGRGSEFHNYPFNGSLPSCTNTITPTPSPTDTPTITPEPSDGVPTPDGSTEVPVPSSSSSSGLPVTGSLPC